MLQQPIKTSCSFAAALFAYYGKNVVLIEHEDRSKQDLAEGIFDGEKRRLGYANEFVVKVEIRLKLKREDFADSKYFGVRRQVRGFQFAITLLLQTFWLLSVYQMTNLNWIGS